jgi:hypothetical protein
MMEYWNVGILGIAEWDLFLSGWHGSEFKIRPSSVFDAQYSIIPQFHSDSKVNSTPLGPDLYLNPSFQYSNIPFFQSHDLEALDRLQAKRTYLCCASIIS